MMTADPASQLARMIALQEAAALKALLAPGVAFRALTPGRSWESDDADEVVDGIILGTWFPPGRRITRILHSDRAVLGPQERVGYRFQAELPDGTHVVEQQAYLRTEGGRISSLRILCSGFLPVE
jgi:hypothetical protein